MDKNRKIAYLAAIGNALIWGAALPIVKPSLSFVSPNQFLFMRFLLAAPLLLPVLIWGLLKSQVPFKKLGTIIFLELLSMTVLFVVYLGLARTAALQASFIIGTKSIFVTLVGVLILKEKEERNELIGLVLSVIGTALILASPIIFNQELGGSDPRFLFGNALVLLAIIFDVFRLSKVKKHYQGLNKFVIVSISAIIGIIYFGVITSFTDGLPTMETFLQPDVLRAVLYMGTVGTGLAFAFQSIAFTRIEISEATLFTYLQPLVYIPLSVLWLKDTLLPTQLVGLIIIAVGVFIAEKRGKKLANRS